MHESSTARQCSIQLVKGSDARQNFALKQLQGGSAARRDKMNLILHVPFCGCSCRVATTDDATSTALSKLGHGLKEGLCAFGEIVELEDACRAVPDDCLR